MKDNAFKTKRQSLGALPTLDSLKAPLVFNGTYLDSKKTISKVLITFSPNEAKTIVTLNPSDQVSRQLDIITSYLTFKKELIKVAHITHRKDVELGHIVAKYRREHYFRFSFVAHNPDPENHTVRLVVYKCDEVGDIIDTSSVLQIKIPYDQFIKVLKM